MLLALLFLLPYQTLNFKKLSPIFKENIRYIEVKLQKMIGGYFMAELKNGCFPDDAAFKEAVCVDVGRVYDSCCDRDCLEDLRCFFLPDAQELVNEASNVRLRSAEVLKVYINVEPVNFHKGFFSCDLTFFFRLEFDIYTSPNTCPQQIKGVTSFTKKVILYGSEGNVKSFSSVIDNDDNCNTLAIQSSNMPKCVVQTVDPIPLSARKGEIHDCYDNVRCIPKCICDFLGGEVITNQHKGDTTIYVTIGLFSIIQLIRNVQMLIPVYDFCIPEKQCDTGTTDQPCDIFSRIKFPTDDFFPPRRNDDCENFGCSCKNNEE